MNDTKMTAIITRRYKAMMAIAVSRERHTQRAEELLHQTLEVAWSKRQTFTGATEGELVQWLKAIMRREWPDNPTRRIARHHVSFEQHHEPTANKRQGYWEQYLSEVMHKVSSASPAFKLFALHGMSYREISDRLDMPVNTIGVRIKRDRRHIMSQLT